MGFSKVHSPGFAPPLELHKVLGLGLAVFTLSGLGCDRTPGHRPPGDRELKEPCAEVAHENSVLLGREVEFDTLGQRKLTTLSDLKRSLGNALSVTSNDPYYAANMSYLGWRASDVLSKFGVDPAEVDLEASFQASDGYEIHLPVQALSEGSAWLVYASSKEEALPPIGPRKQDPGPLYLIWEGQARTNLTTHPRPYSIVKVTVHKRADPMTWLPRQAGSADLLVGEASFRTRCVRCHALNQRGGRVGPDLNVPQNILAYRPEPEVRAYIQNPAKFRYGTMPAHPDLVDPELGQLIEFLRAMAQHQEDPGTTRGSGH